MQSVESAVSSRRDRVRFTREELAAATYDDRGCFAGGRRAELDALRAMGARDPSLGRTYEGHFNGVLLVSQYGTPAQRLRARADAERGELFAVWNTQAADGVTIERTGSGYRLHGAKTWASAADSVTRALITARGDDGMLTMCLVPLDRVETVVDPAAWRPLGMHESNSFRISFEGVELSQDDLIGEPGDYERAPWFLGGALRFAAVHTGIVERLTREVVGYALARKRAEDPFVRERIAEMRIATAGCIAWLHLAEEVWNRYDAAPGDATAAEAMDASDMARTAIERAALDTLERAIRTVGAHGMVEPLPFVRLFRDLHMYLRQPAPDATLMRVAATGIALATASRNGSSGSVSNGAQESTSETSVRVVVP